MLCNTCKTIDFQPLDQYKNSAHVIKDRSNRAFLFTPPDYFDDIEIDQWRKGKGTIHGYFFHHSSGIALLDSAQAGCYLCAMMSCALFDERATLSQAEISFQNMPKLKNPVILTLVLYPGYHNWRVDPHFKLIEVYCEKRTARLDVLDDPEDHLLENFYEDISRELELAWEQREIQPYLSTWSSLNLRLAMTWYEKCSLLHGTCKTANPILPKRVIDLGEPSQTCQPILIQPKEPTHAEYVTLSHCWGDGKPLLPGLFVAATQSWLLIPLCEWEQTFQDAVSVAKSLGFRYLWIDAPCILQGPANQLDWEIESVKMARYFQNASLCICASKAGSSSEGLLSLRNPLLTYSYNLVLEARHDVPEFKRFICAGNERTVMFDQTEAQPSDSPLHGRAWCLQEEYLSPRMLRFCHNRLHWQCLSTYHSECYRGALERVNQEDLRDNKIRIQMNVPKYTSEWGRSRNPHYDAWYSILYQFNGRNISYQSDILPAISGLAEAFSPYLNNDEYLAGVWRGDLVLGLLWFTAGFESTRPESNFNKSSFYAPSWSWLSMAQKDLLFGSYKRREPGVLVTELAQLLSADISLKNTKSVFGLVTCGILRFQSRLPSVVIMPEVKQRPNFHEEYFFAEQGSVKRDIQPRPERRMEMDHHEWQLRSDSKEWYSVSKYQLVGQCELDDYEPRPSNEFYDKGPLSPSDVTINAMFLPLQTDQVEFGRVRTTGLLMQKTTPPRNCPPTQKYYRRIGCGIFHIGPLAWKACKLPAQEICLA